MGWWRVGGVSGFGVAYGQIEVANVDEVFAVDGGGGFAHCEGEVGSGRGEMAGVRQPCTRKVG